MAILLKAAGSWKQAEPYIKVNGTWKKASKIFYKQQGKWEDATSLPKPKHIFEMEVESPEEPSFNVTGGTVKTTRISPGVWEVTSDDPIIHIGFASGKDPNNGNFIPPEVTKVTVKATGTLTSMKNMFYPAIRFANMKHLTEVVFAPTVDTSNVTDMSGMFQECSFLTLVDLSSFNTSKVTDMMGMFNLCERFRALDLSNFDYSSVKTFGNPKFSDSGMFYGCAELTSINTDFSTCKNDASFRGMFDRCLKLKCFGGIDTSNATDANATKDMFFACLVLAAPNKTEQSVIEAKAKWTNPNPCP